MKINNLNKLIRLSILVGFAATCITFVMGNQAYSQVVGVDIPRYRLVVLESGKTNGMAEPRAISNLRISVGANHFNTSAYSIGVWVTEPAADPPIALDLGTLGRKEAELFDVNDILRAVGFVRNTNNLSKPLVYDLLNNIHSELPVPSIATGEAQAINIHGVVVGNISLNQFSNVPVMWVGGNLTYINTNLSTFNYALDINNLNEVVGTHFWDKNGKQNLIPAPLCDTAQTVMANAINDNSEYVGECFSAITNKPIAVMWDNQHNATEILQGNNFAQPNDINKFGEVVGNHDLTAFYYHNSTGVINLNDAVLDNKGYTLLDAYSINDEGEIVGVMRDVKNNSKGFKLIPIK